MLKNRSEKMKNLKIQSIKNENENFISRISKRTGSLDFKKFDRDFENYQIYKQIRNGSKNTPMSKKMIELSPFDRTVCFLIKLKAPNERKFETSYFKK